MTHRTPISAPASSAPDFSDFAEVRSLAATLHDLQWQQAAAFRPIVQRIVQTCCHDTGEIEHALDRILDCACIPEGLALFKSLCRYYHGIGPAAATSYVHAYREMWDSEVDHEQEGAP